MREAGRPAHPGPLTQPTRVPPPCQARNTRLRQGLERMRETACTAGSAVVLHRERAKAEARHRRVHAQPAQVLESAPAGRMGGLAAASGR